MKRNFTINDIKNLFSGKNINENIRFPKLATSSVYSRKQYIIKVIVCLDIWQYLMSENVD